MIARRPLARGDLVLITFPFTDLSSQKLRPALIVGRPSGQDLIVAFITGHVGRMDPRADCLLAPTDPEFPATGLKTASLVRLDKLATLDRALARRRIGSIGPRTERTAADCLRYVFAL